jgi:alcohol dehydrogenase
LWPGTGIVKVPTGLPDEVAAPAGCATATVAAALRVASRVATGGVVLVSGAGMLGLAASAMAKAVGWTVIAVDHDHTRLERAVKFGADRVFREPGERRDLAECLARLTTGRGADLALELTGAAGPTRLALDSLRIGGALVLVGAVMPTPPIEFSPEQVVRRMLTITGVHNYAPQDLTAAVTFLAAYNQRHPFVKLVDRIIPLDDVNEAIRFALETRTYRVGVRPVQSAP